MSFPPPGGGGKKIKGSGDGEGNLRGKKEKKRKFGEDGNVRNVGQILSRVSRKGDLESGSREKEILSQGLEKRRWVTLRD